MSIRIAFDRAAIAAFCRRWNVTEFSLFGSALREDFQPDSDVDVMVAFRSDAHPTLFDLSRMQEELSAMFGRPVDLVTRAGVESSRNEFSRNAILSSAEVIHAA